MQIEPIIDICCKEWLERPSDVRDLRLLAEHSISIPGDWTIEQAYQCFQENSCDFVGVVKGVTLLGVVSRSHIFRLLSGRYGFSLYARREVQQHLMPEITLVYLEMPLLEVLGRALSRSGDAFHHDVALVGEGNVYAGMIPTQTLVRVQSALVKSQIQRLEEQHRILEERNSALFRSSHQLRQSEGRFSILFENSALGAALLSGKGDVQLANRRLSVLLGCDCMGLNLFQFVAAEDRARFAEVLSKHDSVHGSDPWSETAQPSARSEFALNLPDKGPRLFRFSTSWIRETGQICALIDDISEEYEIERQLAQREKAAMLESLVGGIAHELNNKLMPVIGFAELLAMDAKQNAGAGGIKESCSVIQQSATEAAGIVKQLLQLSSPSGLEMRACELRAILEEAIVILRFRLRDSNCDLVCDMPPEPIYVLGDCSQLKQVLVNMALNAIDAMEGRARRMLTFRLRSEKGMAVMHVGDTGCGIAAAYQTRIFDPFFTTKGPNRGTGLGLSVCFSIVRQHCGDLILERTSPEGTTFRISLPMRPKIERSVEVSAQPAGNSAADEAHVPPALQSQREKARVLVIDDEDFITRLIQEALRARMGTTVEQVRSAERAVEQLQREEFDLIICDVRMPGMDGLDLLAWVRRNRPEQATRFFFITGDAGGAELNERLDSIGVPVLRKPFAVDALISQCTAVLREKE